MAVFTHRITIDTQQENEMRDITADVSAVIEESRILNGLVNVFVAHTTAVVMISEYEPGLIHDIGRPLERIAPARERYVHNELNADDNAHSHLIGSVMGPSETVPLIDGRLALGTWQRIVLLELDTHPRSRALVVQVVGE